METPLKPTKRSIVNFAQSVVKLNQFHSCYDLL